MIRVALVNRNIPERKVLRDALFDCLFEARSDNVEIAVFGSIAELCDLLEIRRKDYFDTVICCIEQEFVGSQDRGAQKGTAPEAPLERLARALDERPGLQLVIASHDGVMATAAYRLKASYLNLPGTQNDLRHAVDALISNIGWNVRACLAVRASGHISNVAISDIQFVESSKRGPIIHLPNRKTVVTRGTLKSLYERLLELIERPSQDEVPQEAFRHSFAMAGSSFIINLDNVLASGKGALVFSDGETIIVPVRKRKDIQDALDAFRSGLAESA